MTNQPISSKWEASMPENDNTLCLNQFESVGRNCEFGFVLRHYRVDQPSLFRWTWIDIDNLCRLLTNDFADVFGLENVKPNPENRKMVVDAKYNWHFHSALHSNDKGAFVMSGDAFEKLHRIENAKINREIDIFRRRIAGGDIVCVYVGDVKDVDAARLLEAIDARAGNQRNKLLIVGEPQNAGDVAGKVSEIGERLFRGVVAYLAPYAHADKADFTCWNSILLAFRAQA